jgi:hypothetical protein
MNCAIAVVTWPKVPVFRRINAEGKSLEEVATPLTEADA